MAELTFCVFLVLLGLTLGHPFSKTNVSKMNNRVVGGITAKEGQFPYQVSIQFLNFGHFCGGSILNEKWILTAAHCSQETVQDLSIVVGVADLTQSESEGQKYEVEQVIVHPEFNDNGQYSNDLCLMKIKGSIIFSENVQSINLPKSNMNKGGLPVVASGWGRLSVGGIRPEKLQYLKSEIYDHDSCVERMAEINYFPEIREEHLCLFSQEGEGLCHGDSGGPVVAGNTLVGVISLAYPCARGYPDISVHVWNHLDWIRGYINQQ